MFALLGLGGAILSDTSGSMSDAVSKTLVGALILLLAVFASATLYKWVPAFGDEMASLHHDRKSAQSSGPAAAIDGPAQHANRAMGARVQDSLVGGSKTAGAKAAGAKMGGGTAVAGPVAAGAAIAKAGVDMAKNKATSSPGAQGTDAAGGGKPEQPESQQGGEDTAGTSRAPAAARPQGATLVSELLGVPPEELEREAKPVTAARAKEVIESLRARAERPRTTRARKPRADAAGAASSTSGAPAPVVTADGGRADAA